MLGMRVAFFAGVAVGVMTAGVAYAQDTTTYDVKTINYDLWCQEQANLPADRCDQRLPQDEARYEAYRSTIEKYEIPHLQDKQREQQFDANVLHADPIDNPPSQQKSPQAAQSNENGPGQ
jgi:hypothetical protein